MKTIDVRFRIRRSSPGMGQGLFAQCDIKKGEFILEYTGKKIPTAVADAMETSRYLFEIDEEDSHGCCRCHGNFALSV